MMDKEIWTDIPSYEGIYQLSNLDRVKSFKCNKEYILKPHHQKNGYISYSFRKAHGSKTFRLHVLKMMTYKGFVFDGWNLVIDHIDGNPKNNCLSNLQVISNRENSSKDKKNGTSKYVGVCWFKSKQKWISRILINNKREYLGLFTEEIDAHYAYQKALKELNI
jgi:hypothetical protein